MFVDSAGAHVSTLTQSFVGSYRLLAPIRTGRYTQVWSAIDDSVHRYAAVKVLHSEFRRDPYQQRAMRQEFKVATFLRHPGCLGAFELCDSSHGMYLLMELFFGDNLRDALKKRPAAVRGSLQSIVCQAAEGVAHLNTVGFVHLDVKPDNFMLNDAGEVRLIDFALARRIPNAWERFFWRQRQRSVHGTRSYMSPEQIRREPVDVRADVYSFGCTLYHLATGLPPFTASTSDELLIKHLHAAPPKLLVDAPDATPEFADLVRRMMAKRREERPNSMGELLPQLAGMQYWKSETADDDANTSTETRNAG